VFAILIRNRKETANPNHSSGNKSTEPLGTNGFGHERQLHGTLTEVAAALGRIAVGVLGGDVLELALPRDDLLAQSASKVRGVVAGRGGDGDAFGVPPRGLAAGVLVLDQDVGGAHLHLGGGRAAAVVAVAGAGGGLRAAALVGGHRPVAIAAAGTLAAGVAGGSFRPYLGVLGLPTPSLKQARKVQRKWVRTVGLGRAGLQGLVNIAPPNRTL
jgi:hypothetical protein